MHTKIKMLFVVLGVFLIACTAIPAVQAQETGLQYQLLEKIPGTENLAGSNLPDYISALYKIALVIVTLSAVLMLSIGGFLYLTSAGNTSSMGNAKEIIYDSLIGLVIALSAWLVLYVINPDLVELNMGSLSPMAASSLATNTTPTGPAPGGYYTHDEAKNALSAAGIVVTSSGNCSDMNNRTCTSLETIPKSTIENLIKLKAACGCNFNVTGGTEIGHATHGINRPIVDVSENDALNAYLKKQRDAGVIETTDGIKKICASKKYISAAFNCPGFYEAKPHFHLQFKP